MNLKRYQYHFFILPAVLATLSIIALALWGLKPGIDLAGGSLLQIEYPNERPSVEEVENAIAGLGLGTSLVQPTGENGYILRQRSLTTEEKAALDAALAGTGEVRELEYNSVGPTIGAELLRKAWWAIGFVVVSTIIFIAFAFRGVSYPVASWKYGVVAIITLAHDILLPTGLFAYLGYARGTEIGALFIVALLTILGISINDTIVIFDRIRENLRRNQDAERVEPYADVVWRSVRQTLARSVNTSGTVIIMLLALLFIGPESTYELALALTVGMIAGTYSSIFLAAPLLVLWEKYQKPPKPKEEVAATPI